MVTTIGVASVELTRACFFHQFVTQVLLLFARFKIAISVSLVTISRVSPAFNSCIAASSASVRVPVKASCAHVPVAEELAVLNNLPALDIPQNLEVASASENTKASIKPRLLKVPLLAKVFNLFESKIFPSSRSKSMLWVFQRLPENQPRNIPDHLPDSKDGICVIAI